MTELLIWTDLTESQFWLLLAITSVAGLVRGFSGFALSAVVMASAATFVPPVQLIPICFWLEVCASVLMIRGGWQDADRRIVTGLVLGSIVGTPIGLALTTSLPVETSKLIVLVLVVTLALTQLFKVRFAFLASQAGLYLSGITAGLVSGLAAIGGMVVALYVLSQDSIAREMRGSLVVFLCLSLLTSFFFLIYFEVMTLTAMKRAAVFAVPTLCGVVIGQIFFTARLEPYYRPFCLTLLTGLAMTGLIRSTLR